MVSSVLSFLSVLGTPSFNERDALNSTWIFHMLKKGKRCEGENPLSLFGQL